ncbi:MAG: AraC family transcriptional regulator [Labilithrix sp.]|nr:AraC family transcriptional regulator [Labilithrix sp.]MCW5815726.1 AraC family transcriptional regulator [Labilithrix sp.]
MADLPDLANRDYVDRVNRAIDHVTRNLAEPLKLEEVAKVACFSPYHFHRVFRAVVGETLHDFVKRVRLERALHLVAHGEGSLTEIALACGFGSSSDFSRSFRKRFGVSPRAFDLDALRRERRDELLGTLPEGHRVARLPEGASPDRFKVRLRDLPARRVAYRRVFRPYEGNGVAAATEQMLTWARARGLAGGQWLGYQWEDPEIVPLDRCRYDVGVEIADDVALDGEVSEASFPPMKVAEIDVAGSIDLEVRALEWLYATWLPRSGFVPDHQPGFEAWVGEPFAHGTEHFELRVQLAVTPSRGGG